MKGYTDIEQSKKLAEILPLESADMYIYKNIFFGALSCFNGTTQVGEYVKLTDKENKAYPCWSLAALLSVLPDSIYDNTDKYSQLEFSKISVAYHDMNDGIKVGSIKDNLLDACYEMILKLHEQNLL